MRFRRRPRVVVVIVARQAAEVSPSGRVDVDYTPPPAIGIDMDPAPPLDPNGPLTVGVWATEDEWRGLYL